MCPQPAHRRKWSHQPPLARHSTHPEPLGGIAGSMSMSVQHVDFWPRYLQIITSVAETRGFAIPAKESVALRSDPVERCTSDPQRQLRRRSRLI